MLNKFFPKNKKLGFTLIELLVVISVIGLLSSVVLVAMGGARQKARDAKRQADMRQIGIAMELYYPDNNEKYLSVATGGADVVTAIPSTCPASPCYMGTVPKDPLNVAPQQYTWAANSTDLQKYCVYAKLEATTNNYVCSSERGTLTKIYATGAPALSACCY